MDQQENSLILKNKIKILSVTGKSKTQHLSDIKVGDTVKIYFPVMNTGYNGYSASCEYRINEGKPIKEYLKKVVDWLHRYCTWEVIE